MFELTVIDVDEYWKKIGKARQKEEDLWFAYGTEPDPSKKDITLVEVKSNERSIATERDYSQLIKYLNRHEKEFGNPSLRGMLVINHSYLTVPSARMNAFTPALIADALSDDVTLVTTWDLFRLVRAVLGSRVTSEQVRSKLNQSGPLEVGS